MTDRQVKHLSKTQMLEILRSQEQLIADLEARLSANGSPETVGSLTEAAAGVSELMAAAQKTADTYLEAIRLQKAAADAEAARILDQARAEAEAIRAGAQAEPASEEAAPAVEG